MKSVPGDSHSPRNNTGCPRAGRQGSDENINAEARPLASGSGQRLMISPCRGTSRRAPRRSPTAGNRGQGGKWLWPKTRLRVYARDNWRCVWCRQQVFKVGANGVKGIALGDGIYSDGMRLPAASIDHAVPRSRGGTNDPSNLITCCARCNARRGHKSLTAFALELATVFIEREGMGMSVESILRRVENARRRKLPAIGVE